jgi:hypothetical protein
MRPKGRGEEIIPVLTNRERVFVAQTFVNLSKRSQVGKIEVLLS